MAVRRVASSGPSRNSGPVKARFVGMARSEMAKRGLANVKIVQADALNTALDKEAFDLVHERLVMINVPAREALLQEMLSLLRPGGVIVLEDVDNVSWTCFPMHPSWTILLDAFHATFHTIGGNASIGRELPTYLRNAGVTNVGTKAHAAIVNPGVHRRTRLLLLLDSLRDKVIGSGALSERELGEHRAALAADAATDRNFVSDELSRIFGLPLYCLNVKVATALVGMAVAAH
jgi:SAM-dependent methyltransferase